MGPPMVRYVGVIGLFFHVLQLLTIGFTQQNLCCISDFTMKNLQKIKNKKFEKWTSPKLVMDIGSACLLTFELDM